MDLLSLKLKMFPENGNRSLLIAVIVLASLLGVAALLLIVCLIVNLRSRRHNPQDQNEYEQVRVDYCHLKHKGGVKWAKWRMDLQKRLANFLC